MFNQFAKHEDAFRDWRRDGLLLNIVTGGAVAAFVNGILDRLAQNFPQATQARLDATTFSIAGGA